MPTEDAGNKVEKRLRGLNNRLIIIARRTKVLSGFPVGIQDVGSISRSDNSFHLSFVFFSLWLGDYLQRTSGRPTTRYALRLRCFEPTTRFDEQAFDLRPTFDRKKRLPGRKVSERCTFLSFLLPRTFFLLLATVLDIRERNGLTFRINQPMRQKCQKKGYRMPPRACWLVRWCSITVFHSVGDRNDEVRRHE